jgi:pimeloyl-ACP methyl ester carboxylesterase
MQLNEELPSVRPNFLYVFGEKSMISLPHLREDKMKRTGTGLNENGGVVSGNVEGVTMDGGVHMLPMERTEDVAAILAPWLERQVTRYAELGQWDQDYDRGTSENAAPVLSKQ